MSNALPIPSDYSQDFMEGAVKFVELLRTAAAYPNLISWGMRQRGDWDNPDQLEASLARAQQVLFDLMQVAEQARKQFLNMKRVAAGRENPDVLLLHAYIADPDTVDPVVATRALNRVAAEAGAV